MKPDKFKKPKLSIADSFLKEAISAAKERYRPTGLAALVVFQVSMRASSPLYKELMGAS